MQVNSYQFERRKVSLERGDDVEIIYRRYTRRDRKKEREVGNSLYRDGKKKSKVVQRKKALGAVKGLFLSSSHRRDAKKTRRKKEFDYHARGGGELKIR